MIKNLSLQRGFGIIEIAIAIAILGLAFFGIFQSAVFYLNSFDKVEKEIKASYLAQEAMEAVRSFRKEKTWSGPGGITSLTAVADYYPSSASGEWLMVSGQELIDGIFTRRVVFDKVSRDANDDIESVYNIVNDDPDTRKVTVEVSRAGEAKKVILITYITNFAKN